MKALVFLDAGVMRLQDVPEPVAAPGETLLTVRASGICGSELHGFRSLGFRVPPLAMGHEFAGETPTGERVVVNPLLSCGDCDRCHAGQPQLCRHRALIGVNRDGGFAERVAVPDSAIRPLSDSLSWTEAALIEPLANAVHIWGLLPAGARRVAVIGGGPIGLLCALLGHHGGVDTVISELAEERLEVARGLGLQATTALDGEFDAVIDAAGTQGTRRASLDHLRLGGTSVWLGLAADAAEISGHDLIRQEKRVLGSFAYTPAEFDEAIRLAPQLKLQWATSVSLDDAERTFYALAQGDHSMMKAVIVPDRPDGEADGVTDRETAR